MFCDPAARGNPMILWCIWKPHSSCISSGMSSSVLRHHIWPWADFSMPGATYPRSMWPKIGIIWLILVCRSIVALMMKAKNEVENEVKNEGIFQKNRIISFVQIVGEMRIRIMLIEDLSVWLKLNRGFFSQYSIFDDFWKFPRLKKHYGIVNDKFQIILMTQCWEMQFQRCDTNCVHTL